MRRSLYLLLLVALPLHMLACDACGCSVAGPSALGLLPATRNHFAGLSVQTQSFHNNNAEQRAYTFQVWGRYSPTKRLQLYVFVPYRFNTVTQKGTQSFASGLGDVSLLAQYVVLRREAKDNYPAQVLLAGVGVKAPVGLHHKTEAVIGETLPNSQPGTGAWDGQLAASYTLTGKRVGLNAEASYVLTTANADDYKYGNRLGAGITGFLRRRAVRLEWLPMVGARYEFLLHDYNRYSRRWLDTETGGSVAYAQAGLQAYHKRIGFSALWSQPVWQAPAGSLQASARVESNLTFFF